MAVATALAAADAAAVEASGRGVCSLMFSHAPLSLTAMAGAAAAAAGGNPDVAVATALAAADAAAVEASGTEVFGSVADANLYAGLQGC